MKFRRTLSLVLALALAVGQVSTVLAVDAVALPSEEKIASLSEILPVIEAETEEEAQAALDALAEASLSDKLLALAQIGAYADSGQADMECLIAFLPAIGEDLRDGLDAATAEAILSDDRYGDAFKIYVMDLALYADNFESNSYNQQLVDLVEDETEAEEVRIYAAHNMDADRVSDPVPVYEQLYADADDMGNKMLMLKDIGFIEPATARELSLDVLENYEQYDSNIVTMANKAYIRSIDGEQELIDRAVAMNREMMAEQDLDLTEGCVLALAELEEPEAVELIFELESFDGIYGTYKLLEYNFDGVVAYTDETGIESLARIVQSAPVEEFIPVIESKLMQRSATPEEREVLEELLLTIEVANSEVETYVASSNEEPGEASSTNLNGYAVYRDGVSGEGEGDKWHAGIILSSSNKSYSGITLIGHHSGSGATSTTDWRGFLKGNSPMGVRCKTLDDTTRNGIIQTADDLVTEAIGYTFLGLIAHNLPLSGPKYNIALENITAVRCDGFVEYAYEVHGLIIRGGNISTITGAEYDNSNSIEYTPRHQAGCMTKVSVS